MSKHVSVGCNFVFVAVLQVHSPSRENEPQQLIVDVDSADIGQEQKIDDEEVRDQVEEQKVEEQKQNVISHDLVDLGESHDEDELDKQQQQQPAESTGYLDDANNAKDDYDYCNDAEEAKVADGDYDNVQAADHGDARDDDTDYDDASALCRSDAKDAEDANDNDDVPAAARIVSEGDDDHENVPSADRDCAEAAKDDDYDDASAFRRHGDKDAAKDANDNYEDSAVLHHKDVIAANGDAEAEADDDKHDDKHDDKAYDDNDVTAQQQQLQNDE